jgi:hypothetical protein
VSHRRAVDLFGVRGQCGVMLAQALQRLLGVAPCGIHAVCASARASRSESATTGSREAFGGGIALRSQLGRERPAPSRAHGVDVTTSPARVTIVVPASRSAMAWPAACAASRSSTIRNARMPRMPAVP